MENEKQVKPEIRVELDHAWGYYHDFTPQSDTPQYHKSGWCVAIGGDIKYFQGTYQEAVNKAKELAWAEGINAVFVKP